MKYRASKIALMGLLFALAMALSWIESAFSGLIPIPGVKPGLSNIVVMYCLFFLGPRDAFTLAALKALFVCLTRGPVGAAMSLAGGVLSLLGMLLLRRGGCSVLFVSVCGGLLHNAGQLVAAFFILSSSAVFYYFPVLAVAGMGMGVLTGVSMRLLTPHFKRILQ